MARQTTSTRGKRNQYTPLEPVPSRFRLRALSPNERTGTIICVGVLLAVWIGWFIYTRPVRGELGRVEKYLESLPQLEKVDLAIPWFSRTMPDTVEVTATGLPPGSFQYEVHVELKGTYDTKTHSAKLNGVKQVLMPYTKIKIDWDLPVPPP
jgi:hypothetical protein